MSQKIVQTPVIALVSPLSAASTSAIIAPYPVDLDGVKLVTADFGDTPTFTVDPKISGYEEINSFTSITDNGDGTATLNGLTRNLLSKSPYTVSPYGGKIHGSGATVVFSDNPQVFARFASKENDEIILGKFNFTQSPTVPNGTLPTDAVSKAQLDAASTGTATYESNIIAGVAGENLTAGQFVYFKLSDQKWWLTDADTVTTFQDLRVGIAQATVTADLAVNVLISGLDKTQTGLTPGAKYYLSNTGGAIVATTDQTNIVFVGWAKSATSLLMSYRFDTAGSPYAFSAQYYSKLHTTTVALDWNNGNVQTIQLASGDQTFTFANPQAGARYILILKQPAGGAAGTVTWPTIKWTGGVTPTLTVTNSKYDIVSLIYDGTNYYGTVSYNF